MGDQPDSTLPQSIQDSEQPISARAPSPLRHKYKSSVLDFHEDEDELGEGAPALKDAADTEHPHMMALDIDVDHAGNTVYMRGQSAAHTQHPPIVIIHDFGGNSSQYRSASKLLIEQGFSTYSFDLRGHGRSGRQLGHIPHFQALVNDMLQVSAWVRHREGGRSPIIIGHGLGAVVATHFHLRFPRFCHALVLVAPSLRLVQSFSPVAKMMVTTLADIFPKLRLPAALTPRFYSLIKQEGRNGVKTKKLATTTRISAQFAKEMLLALETAPARFLRIKCETLILLPEKDHVAEKQVVMEMLERHKRRGLFRVVPLENTTHNMLTENEKSLGVTIDTLCDWVKKLEASSQQETTTSTGY